MKVIDNMRENGMPRILAILIMIAIVLLFGRLIIGDFMGSSGGSGGDGSQYCGICGDTPVYKDHMCYDCYKRMSNIANEFEG